MSGRSSRAANRVVLDRRAFIVATGAVAVAYQPFAALAQAAPVVGATSGRELLADWTVDDMWGVHPRPHEPIGFGRPRDDGEPIARVAPVDAAFLA